MYILRENVLLLQRVAAGCSGQLLASPLQGVTSEFVYNLSFPGPVSFSTSCESIPLPFNFTFFGKAYKAQIYDNNSTVSVIVCSKEEPHSVSIVRTCITLCIHSCMQANYIVLDVLESTHSTFFVKYNELLKCCRNA